MNVETVHTRWVGHGIVLEEGCHAQNAEDNPSVAVRHMGRERERERGTYKDPNRNTPVSASFCPSRV